MKLGLLILGVIVLLVTPTAAVQLWNARASDGQVAPLAVQSSPTSRASSRPRTSPSPNLATSSPNPSATSTPTTSPFPSSSPAPITEDLDQQTLSLSGEKLSISNGNSVTFPAASSTQSGWLSSTDWSSFSAKSGGYSFSDGLSLSGSTVTVDVTTGRDGGQTINGGKAAGENLTINSTTNQSQGNIYLNPTGGSVGIGTTTPASKLSVAGSFRAGNSGQFTIDGSGNITSINGVAYSFPSSQGSSSQVLVNNGSGLLTWQAQSGGGGSVTPNSLDFSDFKNAMTLDGNLTIAAGSNYSINIDSNTLVVDTANNRVGIGTASPASALDVQGDVKIGTNNTITLTGDNSVGTIIRALTFKSTTKYDRPWTSYIDYDGRHVAAFGIHNTNAGDDSIHKRFEIKTVADDAGATPNAFLTRFAIDYDADLTNVLFPDNKAIIIANDYGTQDTIEHRMGNTEDGTGDTVIGEWNTNVNGSNNTILTLDAKTMTATNAATIRMFRETNTSGARRLSILKGDNTTTETFGIDAANGNIDNVNNVYVTTNLGIGTSSPDSRLQIAATGGVLNLGDNTNTGTYMTMAGSRTMTGYDGSNAVIQGGTSKGIKFNVNSSSFGAGTAMTLTSTGNLGLGVTAAGTSATKTLAIGNGTAPSTSIVDGVQLYAEDVAASSELRVRDEAGNVTTLSPHNFSLIPDGRSEGLAWSYYSEQGDQAINVDMTKAMRLIEELSGEKLVFTKNLKTGADTSLAQIDRIFARVGETVHMLRAMVFEKPVTFLSKVTFGQILSFNNKDAAGKAKILAGQNSVHVNFTQTLESDPIVTVTPVGSAASYYVTDITKTGFTIKIDKAVTKEQQFHWLVVLGE